MSQLTDMTLAQMRDGLRNKEFSAHDLAEAHLTGMKASRVLNAFLVETGDKALDVIFGDTSAGP